MPELEVYSSEHPCSYEIPDGFQWTDGVRSSKSRPCGKPGKLITLFDFPHAVCKQHSYPETILQDREVKNG